MKNGVLIFAGPNKEPNQVSGQWITDSLFLPESLHTEFYDNESWAPFSILLCSHFETAPFMVSSVKSDFLGKPRKATSSHMRGFSLDIAPVFTKDKALHPELKSPRMADDRSLALFIAGISPDFPCGIVLEGDHFHIDARYPSGCFLYSTYRSEYNNDRMSKWRMNSLITKRMFEALPSGEIILLSDRIIEHVRSFD